MAISAWHPANPGCLICAQDELYDRSGRHPAAAVRVGICREPYALDVCGRHLARLQQELPARGVWILKRYQRGRRHDGQR